jgi:NADH-quinone oxidoreductase subunit L
MTWIVQNLWLIPALPIFAAGISALLKQRSRVPAASLAIGSMATSLLLSLCAFAHVLTQPASDRLQTVNFAWFTFGDQVLKLGWMLNPLTAVMLVMVTFVGLLIFIYSTGYMEHDENFTRFFCFLALFAGGMLGVLIANSLLLLFMCWEIVGLTSYLLIGFWYSNPKAAAAAKKAFITTRIGDLGFLIGMVWLTRCSSTTQALAASSSPHSPISSPPPPSSASPRPLPSASSSFAEQPANPARFRSTSGCPMPWKALRPSAPSSTQPPW